MRRLTIVSLPFTQVLQLHACAVPVYVITCPFSMRSFFLRVRAATVNTVPYAGISVVPLPPLSSVQVVWSRRLPCAAFCEVYSVHSVGK